ncbi:hypothetical protein F4604DRAFT_1903705 [Suillus subluteus]|nr:hypothetical protein F4604DRAFT_1903705 [Suillus subluteus]
MARHQASWCGHRLTTPSESRIQAALAYCSLLTADGVSALVWSPVLWKLLGLVTFPGHPVGSRSTIRNIGSQQDGKLKSQPPPWLKSKFTALAYTYSALSCHVRATPLNAHRRVTNQYSMSESTFPTSNSHNAVSSGAAVEQKPPLLRILLPKSEMRMKYTNDDSQYLTGTCSGNWWGETTRIDGTEPQRDNEGGNVDDEREGDLALDLDADVPPGRDVLF